MSRVITLTSPSGATLKTKEKYVDDDIAIQVDGAENITANNIKSGVTILGVSGTLPPAPSGTLNITENGTYDVSGYENVTVEIGGSSMPTHMHDMKLFIQDVGNIKIRIDNDSSTPFTKTTLANWLVSNHYEETSYTFYTVHMKNSSNWGYIALGIAHQENTSQGFIVNCCRYNQSSNKLEINFATAGSGSTLTDTVTQL